MARREVLVSLLLSMACGCATPGYSPCPLDLDRPLPSDAFSRCVAVLRETYGTLAEVDAEGFRVQTDWQPIADPVGERRATIYRDPVRERSLAVVVELRRLSLPIVGPPRWTTVQGDQAAERELAEQLRAALSAGRPAPADEAAAGGGG